jgi:putative O-methyltransferase
MSTVAASTESYLKVQYDLRPAKQVERRMLIDTLHMLAAANFPIRDYQYTGFGSIYFVDFILFHKLLGIKRMTSIEHSERIKSRVRFNKPYASVDIFMGSASEVIPRLSSDRRHLLWLDYDDVLNASQLTDIRLAATYLSPGSLLLVTVDAEPPGDKDDGPAEWGQHFHQEAGELAANLSAVGDFRESNLAKVNVQIIERAIKAGMAGRDAAFFPLFNFLYADGHRMLTVGGMVVTDPERRQILGSEVVNAHFVRLDLRKPPYPIRVPRLTRKERIYMDSMMPCKARWKPRAFELPTEDVQAYRQIYPFFPAYAELLL